MKKDDREGNLAKLVGKRTAELHERGKQLKSSEALYRKMIDEVEDYAIILLDREGIIQNWNKGAEKIKRYSATEIVGKSFKIFYLPEDQQSQLPERLMKEACDNGRAIHDGWRVRKDGSRFWGSVAITALHDNQNQIIGFSKVTRDLTERKEAEDQLVSFAEKLKQSNEELRKSEERYHKMISEVQDYAIILLSREGNIENWNMGAEFIKGYTAEEIVGKNFEIFYTEPDRKTNLPQRLLKEASEKGKATHEGWRKRKDGTMFWGSIVITALHDKDGTVIGFSKVTRDLTEKKAAEDKLREYASELEAQNKELEQFAYIASHDLQEPLRKIQTFTDIIQKNMSDKTMVVRYFEKIKGAAQRMSELIRSVLNYSKLSKAEEQFVDTDLNLIITHLKTDFELLIQEKHAQIRSETLPVIKAIPQQLSQLFSNLISNSLKFSDKNPLITIKAKVVEPEKIVNRNQSMKSTRYLEIEFADNGIGFEQQYEQQIFTMFQRLHGRHEYEGTGIGLALCKKIIDNHNGQITAKSELGKGTTFYIYLPVL